jgi:hypothetical protein
MSEVFITKARLGSIASFVAYQTFSEKNIYNFYEKKLLDFFSKPELKKLTAIKLILDSIENQPLRAKIIEVHKNAKERIEKNKTTKDSRWIYFGSKPAYHGNKDCIHLHSKYENYEIPVGIPDDRIEEYRAFFLDPKNNSDYMNHRDRFFSNVGIKFHVRIENLNEVHIDNSGQESINMVDTDSNQILEEIHQTVRKMNEYKNESTHIAKIVSNTGFNTKAALKNSLFSDDKPIITRWDEYKSKLRDLMTQGLISTIAPDYKFDHKFLEDLGFRKCSTCF